MRYESSNELYHFGIKGQKWGVRRFQNEDGTLTEEGKKRYSNIYKQVELYNKTTDEMNKKLGEINKRYPDLEDDETYLKYVKEIRESFQKSYRDVLARDIVTDPKTLEGQEWLKDMFGYTSLDEGVSIAEERVNKKKASEPSITEIDIKDPDPKDPSFNKYANTKMSQAKAIETAYNDLEKLYPNFSDLSIDKQDELFFNYLNTSGLYKWV